MAADTKALLDYIGDLEAQGNYNAYYGNAGNSSIDFTGMSVRDVVAWQKEFGKTSPSSAVGKYQFIPKTLNRLITQYGVSPDAKFTPELQDKLAEKLLRERGLKKWEGGTLTTEAFGNNLAKEWASLPLLNGANAGFSYYANDGLNHALDSADNFSSVLKTASGHPVPKVDIGAGVSREPGLSPIRNNSHLSSYFGVTSVANPLANPVPAQKPAGVASAQRLLTTPNGAGTGAFLPANSQRLDSVLRGNVAAQGSGRANADATGSVPGLQSAPIGQTRSRGSVGNALRNPNATVGENGLINHIRPTVAIDPRTGMPFANQPVQPAWTQGAYQKAVQMQAVAQQAAARQRAAMGVTPNPSPAASGGAGSSGRRVGAVTPVVSPGGSAYNTSAGTALTWADMQRFTGQTVRGNTTTTVRRDGTTSTTPRAGSVALPADYRPNLGAAPVVSANQNLRDAQEEQRRITQMRPQTVTKTIMVPNPAYRTNPNQQVTTPTGAKISVSQMDAIRGVPPGSYRAPIQPTAPNVPKFIPKVVTETVMKPVQITVRGGNNSTSSGGSAPRPPTPQTYTSGGYTYQQNSNGGYTKTGVDPSLSGMTPSQRYDYLNGGRSSSGNSSSNSSMGSDHTTY